MSANCTAQSDREQVLEEWRPIVGHPHYRVSNLGNVQTCAPSGTSSKLRPWRRLKPSVAGRGYLTVQLQTKGSITRKYVHRLVLETFVGPCPVGMECRHVENNDRKDNRLANLAWGTPQENSDDTLRHGSRHTGLNNHPTSKLTPADVENIIDLHTNQNITVKDLATMYGMRRENISKVLNGHHWKSVRVVRKFVRSDFPDHVPPEQAATAMGVTRERVYQLIKAGTLTCVRYNRGVLLDPGPFQAELAKRIAGKAG